MAPGLRRDDEMGTAEPQVGRAVGRTTISLMSTAGGCSMASAMAAAGIATPRYSTIRYLRPGSEMVSVSSECTAPGEMMVTRAPVPGRLAQALGQRSLICETPRLAPRPSHLATGHDHVI